MINDI